MLWGLCSAKTGWSRYCATADAAIAAAAAAAAVAWQTPCSSCWLHHLCRLHQHVNMRISSAPCEPHKSVYQLLQCTTVPMYQRTHLGLQDGMHRGASQLLDDRENSGRLRCGRSLGGCVCLGGSLRRCECHRGRQGRLRAQHLCSRRRCGCTVAGREAENSADTQHSPRLPPQPRGRPIYWMECMVHHAHAHQVDGHLGVPGSMSLQGSACVGWPPGL